MGTTENGTEVREIGQSAATTELAVRIAKASRSGNLRQVTIDSLDELLFALTTSYNPSMVDLSSVSKVGY